jgi:hypothetical protein
LQTFSGSSGSAIADLYVPAADEENAIITVHSDESVCLAEIDTDWINPL